MNIAKIKQLPSTNTSLTIPQVNPYNSIKTVIQIGVRKKTPTIHIWITDSYTIIQYPTQEESVPVNFWKNIFISEEVALLHKSKSIHFSKSSVTQRDITSLDVSQSEQWKDAVTRHKKNKITFCIPHSNINTQKLRDHIKNVQLLYDTTIYINNTKLSANFSLDYTPHSYSVKNIVQDNTIFVSLSCSDNSNSISVYNDGIYSGEIADTLFSGKLITKLDEPLPYSEKADFSIQNYPTVTKYIQKSTREFCDILSVYKYTDTIREFMADSILSEKTWKDKPIFKSITERFFTMNQIKGRSIIFAEYGDNKGDKIAMRKNKYLVLDNSDIVTQKLQEYPSLYTRVPISEVTLTDEKQIKSISSLSKEQRIKLGVARYIADTIGIDRAIYYGTAKTNLRGWTDGDKYIVITDKAMKSKEWIEWVPSLFKTLIHEYSHTKETINNRVPHGTVFSQKYHTNIEQHWNVLSETIAKINSESLTRFDIGYTERV